MSVRNSVYRLPKYFSKGKKPILSSQLWIDLPENEELLNYVKSASNRNFSTKTPKKLNKSVRPPTMQPLRTVPNHHLKDTSINRFLPTPLKMHRRHRSSLPPGTDYYQFPGSPRNSQPRLIPNSHKKRKKQSQEKAAKRPRRLEKLTHSRPMPIPDLSPSILTQPLELKASFTPRKRKSTESKTFNTTNLQTVLTSELSAKDVQDQLYKDHIYSTFLACKMIRDLPEVDPAELESKILTVKRATECKKLIIFDLDETLVHTLEEGEVSGEHTKVIEMWFPTGTVVQARVNIRPFAIEALQAANQSYEVAVFTASSKSYADPVLDYLDPDHTLIHHRFYRDNCLKINNLCIKDLRIFSNYDLKDIVIIDNIAYSFAHQITNGIPIITWHADMLDTELENLIDFITYLAGVDDVREYLKETFHMNTFYEDYTHDFGTGPMNAPINQFSSKQ